MKPYGREKLVKGRPFKKDYHFKKDRLKNWWEGICDLLSRGRMKQIMKKEIEKDLDDK